MCIHTALVRLSELKRGLFPRNNSHDEQTSDRISKTADQAYADLPQLWRGIYTQPSRRQMVLQALPIVRLGYGAERAAQDNNGKFNKDKGFSRAVPACSRSRGAQHVLARLNLQTSPRVGGHKYRLQ